VTYRCTAACGHCIQNSSMQREGHYITRDEVRGVLQEVRSLGCRSLHIGGGEPFIDLDGLCVVMKEMRSAGMEIDYLETNGFWAKDKKRAVETARRIAGIANVTVMLSLCPYHAPYVPLASVRNALEACAAAGLYTFVWQEQFAREVMALGDESKTHTLAEYEAMFPGAMDKLPARFGVNLLGRAAATHQNLRSTPVEALLAQSAPCAGPLRAGHFHVDCFGDFQPPGCPGLGIGLQDAGDIAREKYPTVYALTEGGVRALYDAAASTGFVAKRSYGSLCALCQDARAHLALRDGESWPDLRPHGFYEEILRTGIEPLNGFAG